MPERPQSDPPTDSLNTLSEAKRDAALPWPPTHRSRRRKPTPRSPPCSRRFTRALSVGTRHAPDRFPARRVHAARRTVSGTATFPEGSTASGTASPDSCSRYHPALVSTVRRRHQ